MRRSLTLITACASAALTFGCSTETAKQTAPVNQQEQKAAPEVAEVASEKQADLEKEYKELPQNVVLRVELDEEGNEIEGSAKMIATNDSISEDSVDGIFAANQVIESSASDNNFDGDSSANSWYGYNNVNYGHYSRQTTLNYYSGWGGVNAQVYGSAQFSSYSTSRYFNSYRPLHGSHVQGGAYWRYGQPWCYPRVGYRYYHYPRPRCQQYQFCAW